MSVAAPAASAEAAVVPAEAAQAAGQAAAPSDRPPVVDRSPPQAPNFGAIPFTRLLGVQRALTEGGVSRMVLDERADLANPTGSVHGGVVATLLDVVMASAIVSGTDFTHTAVTLNLNCSFHQPGRGRLLAEGRLESLAEQVAHCSAEVRCADGTLVASARGSFKLLPMAAHRYQAAPA